jgi:flagellar biogenesis protein FliO
VARVRTNQYWFRLCLSILCSVLFCHSFVIADSELSSNERVVKITQAHNLRQQILNENSPKNLIENAISDSNENSSKSSLMLLFQGLAFCLGVFFIGLHIYKKYFLKNAITASRSMQIIERLNLGNKSSLVLVEIENKKVLVALGADKILMLENNEYQQYLNANSDLSIDDELKYSDVATRSKACVG